MLGRLGVMVAEATPSVIFDNTVVDFIFGTIGKFLDLFTSNSALAIFLTLGIIGGVVGLTGTFISMARRR